MRAYLLTIVAAAVLIPGVTLPEAGVAQAPGASVPRVEVAVTGDPTPIETLRLAIVTTAREVVPEARRAPVALAQTAPPLEPLPAASGVAVSAVVQVTAAGSQPVTRTVPVQLTNTVFPWSDARVLMVSNSPETIPFSKVLFNGALQSSETARLLYHHQNGSTDHQMEIAVNLSNPTGAPITLWVTGAGSSSGPDDPTAGHGPAHAFLDQYWHHAGFQLQIPANTTIPLFLHELPPQAVASGLVQLALVDGDRLNLQVVAVLDNEWEPPTESYTHNFDTVHQRGIFEKPQIVKEQEYTVGGPPVNMTIGDDRDLLHEQQSGQPLEGNYGVIYTFPVKISNPTSLPAILGLMMYAGGGDAGGSVLVDDQVIDLPRLRAGARHIVTRVHLAAGEQRTVVISTMPESGANYPVMLILGPEYL